MFGILSLMKERIQIVDEHDQPLGYATREEAWAQKLRHRFVRIVLFNEHGEVLIQKRSAQKKKYPNAWTDAATGHVDFGETYEIAAPRELAEEIGVTAELTFLGKFYTEDIVENKATLAFHGVFKGTIPKDTELGLDTSEVSEALWIEPAELKELIAASPADFTPGLRQVVERYL